MNVRTSLWASLAIAASIGLAGCGGSSDNDDPAPAPEVTPPAPPVALTLPAGNNIRDRIDQDDESQTDGFLDDKSATIAAGGTWDYGGVRFSCPTGGSPCKVSFTVDLGGVTATTGGEGSGVATAMLLSTVGTGVGLSTLREEITKGPTPSPSALSRRLGFPEADRQRSGMTSFASRHLKDPTGFTKEASHAAAMAPTAWKGGSWEGEAWNNSTANEMLVRFDNQAPGMTFAKKYGDNVGSSNDVTPAAADEADFWELVSTPAPIFPNRVGPVTVPPTGGGGVGNQSTGSAQFSISATFDGVAGTLSCASGCTLSAEGTKLQGGGTGWKFTATRSSDTVTGIGTQDDYLAFGWWRKASSSGGGFAAFEPVYGGRVPFGTSLDSSGVLQNTETLRGTATYEGGAAGNYTDYRGRKAPGTNPSATGDDAEDRPDRHGGWFVANAKLTAQFGQAGATAAADKRRQNYRDYLELHGYPREIGRVGSEFGYNGQDP